MPRGLAISRPRGLAASWSRGLAVMAVQLSKETCGQSAPIAGVIDKAGPGCANRAGDEPELEVDALAAPTPARARLAVALVASMSLAGSPASTVTRLNSAQKKPNNVWVFFTVEKGDEPAAGLQAEDFQIYEDGEIVSTFESKQVIQNPEVAAVMYTMLLLDVSGSITESGSADSLVDAATLFTDRVGKTQKVGVDSFDGDKEIRAVVPFTEAQGAAVGGLEKLAHLQGQGPVDQPARRGDRWLKELQKQLAKEKKPLKFGTLVIFSDGTDRAARFSRDEMKGDRQGAVQGLRALRDRRRRGISRRPASMMLVATHRARHRPGRG